MSQFSLPWLMSRPGSRTVESSARPALTAHLPTLDSLRGVAILLVLVFHFQTGTALSGKLAALFDLGASTGWVGVDLFFVLSGFLITRILLVQRGKEDYFRNFFARRALRIFPLYYAALTLVTLALVFGGSRVANPDGASMAWLWLYASNFGAAFSPTHSFTGPAVDHFWSLAVEEHFYLVWPLVVAGVATRRLYIVCVAGIVGALACRCGAFAFGGDVYVSYMLTPMRVDALLAGSLLAIIERERGLPRPATMLAGALGAAIAFAVICAIAQTTHPRHVLVGTLGISLAAICGTCLVAAGTQIPITRLPGGRSLAVVGKYSYGLYVWHMAVLRVVTKLGLLALTSRIAGGLIGELLFIALASIASFAVAVASYHLFEKHFLKLKRFFEARPAATEAGESKSADADVVVTPIAVPPIVIALGTDRPNALRRARGAVARHVRRLTRSADSRRAAG